MAEDTLRDVEEYRRELRALGKSAFIRRHPHAVLILQKSLSDEDEAGYVTHQITGDELQRIVRAAKTLERPPPSGVDEQAGRVFEIAKRPGAPFQERIGVGRARNTDVWIPYPTISKYHAYFTHNAAGAYCLTDAGSSNGSLVAGAILEPKKPVSVPDGAKVCFGSQAFLFLSADRFCEVLSSS